MLVDPMQLASITASITASIPGLVPTSTSSSSHSASSTVSPIPSVIPTGVPQYENATEAGQRTLWVVFAIMVIASAAFTAMSWNVPISKRLYHVITTLITVTAAISYFAMATGDGISYRHDEVTHSHKHVPDTKDDIYRQVYWARYVDWLFTTPLLLLDLALLAGMSGAHIFGTIVCDIIMVLTGLFAAFGTEGTPQKWGYYTIACIAYIGIVWNLGLHGREAVKAKGNKTAGFFAAIGGFTLLLWTAYPIVWGLADGSRTASVDAEIIAYAVLDVLAKPVFGLWLLLTHQNLPETNVEIGGFWAHGLSNEGAIRVGDDDDAA